MSIYVEICHTVSDISDVFFRNHAKIITSCSISEEKAIVPATQYINFTYQNLKRSRYDKKNRSDQ